jgi:hypothetical protein
LLDALGIAAQVVPNLPMRKALRGAAFKVREGSAFSRALGDSGQFPPVALRLIASGERSGELPRMLEEAAQQAARTRSLDDGADFGVGPGGNPRGRCDGAVHRARDPAADFRFEPDGEIADRRRRICRRMHAAKPGAASTIERDAAAVAHPEFPPDPGSR